MNAPEADPVPGEQTGPDNSAAQESPEAYLAVPLAIMQPGTSAPVHLYIRSDPGVYQLYKTVQTPMLDETRQRLIERGVDVLYIRARDEDAYLEYVEEHLNDIIRDDMLPTEEASKLVYKSSSRVMGDVFEDPRSGKNMQRAHNMVEATVRSVIKAPEALWQMASIASHDYYTYTHCVNVSMFLVALSREVLGISDQQRLQRIGMGGLLHDIGKSRIPHSILHKPGRLTDEEFNKIKEHPALGEEIATGREGVTPASLRIVRGHHERFDGTGYPDGLLGDNIVRIVRISTICDVYDALTTDRPYADARAPFAAIRLMVNEMKNHFDMPMLRAFVRFMGPSRSKADVREQAEDILGDKNAPAAE